MKYIIDTYSWIDYLEGNDAGLKIRRLIDTFSNEIHTSVLSLAEISSFLRRKGLSEEIIDGTFKLIHNLSHIQMIDENCSKEAGLLHAKVRESVKDFGLTDAFILVTARQLNAKILTGDEHFRKFTEAILLK